MKSVNQTITLRQIEGVKTATFEPEEWSPLIQFFWDRYNKRYFDPIHELQNHSKSEIRNNCGFLIATIDCILIETLEQYYSGKDESEGHNHDPFLLFFQRAEEFQGVIKDKTDAGYFSGLMRGGLLHQSKTKKASIINKRTNTPILAWIDENNKVRGFKLNRDKFHKAVYNQYVKLIDAIKEDGNVLLRERFKSKLATLLE